MKIGIFGGSFNPPHNMHRDIALNLINSGYLDKVIYVPTGDNYEKNGLISFNDRKIMVMLMIDNIMRLELSSIGNNVDYQYTYQVLDYFKEIYIDDEIYFICGSDNLLDFVNWKKYEYILKKYKLLVVKRNNHKIEDILVRYLDYLDNIVITDIDSDMLSSSYIRDNIDDISIIEKMDNKVYKYIKDNGLYLKKQ